MPNWTYFSLIIEKNRIFADFYIPKHSNDMKIAVQKNHIRSQILVQKS